MFIHRRNDGLGSKAVHPLSGRVAVLAISLPVSVSMAGMRLAVESSDPSVLKLKIVKNSPQPGVLDGPRSMLREDVLTDTFDDVPCPGLAKPRFKSADTR